MSKKYYKIEQLAQNKKWFIFNCGLGIENMVFYFLRNLENKAQESDLFAPVPNLKILRKRIFRSLVRYGKFEYNYLNKSYRITAY